jgi:hypothetical protein
MSDELQVASTTDVQATVSAVASGEDGRATVDESSLANFEQSADGKVVSYENPSSERQNLLERLAEAEAEVELPVESYKEGQPADESGLNEKERELIRQAAVQDALEDARRLHRQPYSSQEEQGQQFQAELESARAQWVTNFGNRLNQIRPPDCDELFQAAIASGLGVTNAVADTLTALEHGPETLIYLLRHQEELSRLARLPDHLASASVADLAARLTAPPRRAVSRAPLPISPVSGSPTRSSLPPDEMSYQDYSKFRERQIKARRGR